MRLRLGLCAAALIAALPALAQVEVVEPGDSSASTRYPPPPQRDSRKSSPAPVSESGIGELYNQVLQLQEEVRQLHGQIEEQAEQLRQLKQQRLEDYQSLDRRLGGGGAQSPSGGGSEMPAPASTDDGVSMQPEQSQDADAIRADAAPMAPAVNRPSAPVQGEEAAYQSAYDLIKNRRFPEAATAFTEFLARFPQGALAGNAHFWLGELYLLNGDSESAKPHYEALVYQFPDSQKLPDGMFKLGRIYHQEGDNARAKELLQRVATQYQNSGSSAPRLAAEYLQQNFPGR